MLGGPDGANTAAVRKAINDDILPRHLGFFNKVLEDGGTGWLAGTADPTIADFCIVPRLQWIKASGVPEIGGDALFAPFPHVNALLDKFMAQPAGECCSNTLLGLRLLPTLTVDHAAVMKYYAGITAKCTVGPAGKPCDGKESGQCTGEITLTQLDAATCKIEYDLKGATPGDHGEPHDYALGSGLAVPKVPARIVAGRLPHP